MALRILYNEAYTRNCFGMVQRLLSSERLLSSVPQPAVANETSEPKANNDIDRPKKLLTPFRTTENDPRNHNEQHLTRYYTLPESSKESLFTHGGIPKLYGELSHAFTQTCIMVRKPFLEVKNYIETVDYSKPAVRIVLYGKPGFGKSITLTHILHYGHNAGFMLVHVPWVNIFMRRCKDASPSETKPGMMDVPINAAAWLVHFRTQNTLLLKSLNLKTKRSYSYGPHDVINEGAPLEELIEYGIGRAKYACDVVENLLSEVKEFSNSGLFKTMVVIDGFNGLFAPFLITERRQKLNARCTLALPFLDMTRFDWCNGIAIVTVDRVAHHDMFNAESDLPNYLLGKDGWEHLDPFIPVEVGKYDLAEINSTIDYFIDRRWIQIPEGKNEAGRAELAALCNGNGYDLMKICARL